MIKREKMKTIYSISIVKNEADIIESFIRYNYSYLDGMMVINHNSSDNTEKILENLIKEGYNIYYIKWDKIMHQQGNVLTKFIYELIEEKNPDIIIPIDADEFLVSNNRKNPREELEKLDMNYVHYIDWKTYVPYSKEDSKEFIPNNMKYIRNNEYNEHEKVIIPSKLFEKLDLELENGNHDCNKLPQKNKAKNYFLKMAHYPVRSEDQLISNTLIGGLNTFCIPFREKRRSWHRLKLFDKIRNKEELDLIKVAHEYSSRSAKDKPVLLIYDPIETDFCEDLTIKYSKLSQIDIQHNLINYSKELADEFRLIKEKNIKIEEKLKKREKEIRDLQPTLKWINYKTKNVLSRLKKKILK